MSKIDYKSFIEDNFYIKNKQGILQPFTFNDVQSLWYSDLQKTYGEEMQGIRENNLKGRQFGISSVITAIFATDFILSELGEIPIIDADIYSHKDSETDAHIARFNLFVNSFLINDQGGSIEDIENTEAIDQVRKAFLQIDNGGHIMSRKRKAQYHAQTASAKVSGRGGTKQNIHWSEPAFYPNTQIMNAKTLMVGAEKQVPDNYGKIFRESTGRSKGDYFAEEYYKAKDGRGDYKSRFLAWYLYKDYSKPAPEGWEVPDYYKELVASGDATVDQCYWHYEKTDNLQDKHELREYPTYDFEAFIAGGSPFFSQDALLHYVRKVTQPIKEVEYVSSLS
jgi:hypothetical protein